MAAGEFELLGLDVHADQVDVRKLLPEDCEDGADSAADLEEPRTRLEVRAVADQPVSPMFGLLDKPVLLARSVAVNILGDASRLGSVLHPASESRSGISS
jgi:hypothetical protein